MTLIHKNSAGHYEHARSQAGKDNELNKNDSKPISLIDRAKDIFGTIKNIGNKERKFNHISENIQRSQNVESTLPRLTLELSILYKLHGYGDGCGSVDRNYVTSCYDELKNKIKCGREYEDKIIALAYIRGDVKDAEDFQFSLHINEIRYDKFGCWKIVLETLDSLKGVIAHLKNESCKMTKYNKSEMQLKLNYIKNIKYIINESYREESEIKKMADEYISLCNEEMDLVRKIKYWSDCYDENNLIGSLHVKDEIILGLKKEICELKIRKKCLKQEIKKSIQKISELRKTYSDVN